MLDMTSLILLPVIALRWFLTFSISAFILMILACFVRLISIKFTRRIKPSSQRAILITGATSGIGLLLAKHFYKLGFTVFATFFNEKELGYPELLEMGARTADNGSFHKDVDDIPVSRLFLIQMDIRSVESIENLRKEVDFLVETYNLSLHALINNAGISRPFPFVWTNRHAIQDMVNTNLLGALLVSRQFTTHIIKAKGRIVNVGSGVTVFPSPNACVYATTKSALEYFSESLNGDLKNYGASCCCLLPANFAAASNIIIDSIKNMQETLKELTDEESKMYARSIKSIKAMISRISATRFRNCNEDKKKLAAVYGLNMEELESDKSLARKKNIIKSAMIFIGRLLQIKGDNLNRADFLESYEQAVCLSNVPIRLYPGSFMYAYFAAPIYQFNPPVIQKLFKKIMESQF